MGSMGRGPRCVSSTDTDPDLTTVSVLGRQRFTGTPLQTHLSWVSPVPASFSPLGGDQRRHGPPVHSPTTSGPETPTGSTVDVLLCIETRGRSPLPSCTFWIFVYREKSTPVPFPVFQGIE